MWWDQRRPELIEMFSKYVYGRVPQNVPKVTWTVTTVDHEMIGFTPVIAKDLIGEVDNSSYPAIKRAHPHDAGYARDAKGPVPVLMMFGRAGFPAPNEPSRRRVRPHQRRMESNARAAGSLPERCVRAAPRMAASERQHRSVSRS